MLSFHHHVALTFLLTAGSLRVSCHATIKGPEKEPPAEACALTAEADTERDPAAEDAKHHPCARTAENGRATGPNAMAS